MSRRPRNASGFTLVELLVVMAIIATLAGLGLTGIPYILRESKKTAAKDRLNTLKQHLWIYHNNFGKWPTSAAGAKFVLLPVDQGTVDRNVKDYEPWFDPTTGNEPQADFSNMTEEGIDWTGPSMEGGRRYSPDMRNANSHCIVCNKIPPVNSDDDLDFLPHAGKGIVYLTAGGVVDWQDAGGWSDLYPVVGPESSIEMFQSMQPYDSVGVGGQ